MNHKEWRSEAADSKDSIVVYEAAVHLRRYSQWLCRLLLQIIPEIINHPEAVDLSDFILLFGEWLCKNDSEAKGSVMPLKQSDGENKKVVLSELYFHRRKNECLKK